MSNPITISTATQGTSTATTPAQAGGKGMSFLGMLMAAVSHKPAEDAGSQATATAGAKADAIAQTKTGKGKSTLLAMAGDISAKAAKAKAGVLIDATKAGATQAQDAAKLLTQAGDATAKAKAGTLIDATKAGATPAQDAARLLAQAGDASAKAASAQGKRAAGTGAGQAKAGTLIDATKAGATPAQDAARLLAQAGDASAKTKGKHAAMAKHHDSKTHHHQAGGQAADAAGTASTTVPTAMPQPAVPIPTQARADAQTHAHAQGRASAPMDGSGMGGAGQAAQAGAAAMLAKRDTAASSATSDHATPRASSDATAASAKAEAAKAAASATLHPAMQAADAGIQAEGQPRGKGGVQDTGKASSHTQAAAMASAGQAAKAGNPVVTAVAAAETHPRDAAGADSHAGSSHQDPGAGNGAGNGAGSVHTPMSLPGMHSYSQVAGGRAHRLPAEATLISHAAQPASPRTDSATGPAPTAGQDPTAANMAMAANTGLGQGVQQAAGTPQTPLPQAPTHVSGPWTAMAAMTEIGQAAANGQTRLELKLEPAHLGKIHVRIHSDRRKNIQVHLAVEQPNSRQIIEQQLPNLRHALEQQGLNLGNFSMSSQQQGGGQGANQPQPQAAAAGTPGFNATPAPATQIPHAPAEPMGSGRLSIRI